METQLHFLHSRSVLHLAWLAHHRVAEKPNEAEVCITLSAAAVEGFLNEIPLILRSLKTSETAQTCAELLDEAEESRVQPLMKYRLAVLALEGRLPKKGENEVQRLDCLFKARNGVLHIRPEPGFLLDEAVGTASKPRKPPREIQYLLDQRVVAMSGAHFSSWRQMLHSPSVSRWAHNAAAVTINHIASIAADPETRSRLKSVVSGIPEIPANAL